LPILARVTKLVNPRPMFLDGRGALLDAGYIYIGEVGTDPEVEANQLDLFWDKAQTIPAAQPLRTLGGVIMNGSQPGLRLHSPKSTFRPRSAMRTRNLVDFIPTAFDLGGAAYQPLDADLTAIAALATTAYGRAFLTLANQAALQALVGIGAAGLLDVATAAQFRANTADKVLDTDGVWGAASSVALAQVAGNVAVDLSTGINFTLAMTGTPWTLSNPTNGKDGQSGKIEITQDATGNRILNFGANWLFVGGYDPFFRPRRMRAMCFTTAYWLTARSRPRSTRRWPDASPRHRWHAARRIRPSGPDRLHHARRCVRQSLGRSVLRRDQFHRHQPGRRPNRLRLVDRRRHGDHSGGARNRDGDHPDAWRLRGPLQNDHRRRRLQP
jgi:hypothetical protein